MKKTVIFGLLVIFMVLGFTNCGNDDGEESFYGVFFNEAIKAVARERTGASRSIISSRSSASSSASDTWSIPDDAENLLQFFDLNSDKWTYIVDEKPTGWGYDDALHNNDDTTKPWYDEDCPWYRDDAALGWGSEKRYWRDYYITSKTKDERGAVQSLFNAITNAKKYGGDGYQQEYIGFHPEPQVWFSVAKFLESKTFLVSIHIVGVNGSHNENMKTMSGPLTLDEVYEIVKKY